jgi:hypothetical protein
VAADDVELGHVVDLTLGEPSGTELVAAASIGATTLTVDYAGEFEDAGEVVLNGEVLAYTSIDFGDTETDPDIINLAAPLAAAAAVDDRVGRISGGEEVTDWLLHVSLGDGHPVDIPIPFEQRAMWSNVDTSTPPPVLVSADLERLVEVPGRPPQIDQAYLKVPFITLYQAANVAVSSSAFGTTLVYNAWTIDTETPEAFEYDAVDGLVTVLQPGLYLFTLGLTWAGNSTGKRTVDLVTVTGGVGRIRREEVGSPPDAQVYTQQITVVCPMAVGDAFQMQVQQSSGANLNIRGDSEGRYTQLQAVRLQA